MESKTSKTSKNAAKKTSMPKPADVKDGDVVPVAFVVPTSPSGRILRVEGARVRDRTKSLALTYAIPRPAGKPCAKTWFYVPAGRWTTELSCAIDSLEKVRASQLAKLSKQLDTLERRYAAEHADRPYGLMTCVKSIDREDE